MHISYNNYQRMHRFLKPELSKQMNEVLGFDNDDDIFKYQYRIEKKIGKGLGHRLSIGTSSGTAALQFSLQACGIEKGDEVIIPTNTYIATALAVSAAGGNPVFVDVNPDTLLLDDFEDAITEKTKAVLPVHLFGQMMDMKRISKIARKHGLSVIEDACQAHKSRFDGNLPGSFSDAACYSFSANKNLGAGSNGGLVAVQKRSILSTVEKLRNPESNSIQLLKSRRTPAFLDWIQMPFILSKLQHLDSWIDARRKIAEKYHESLDVQTVKVNKKAFHTYRDFVIRVKNRNRLRKRLARAGIETKIHYQTPLHQTEPFMNEKTRFANVEKASGSILSLPINPFLTMQEIEYVIRKVNSSV